jgi:hypothetical protein
LHFFLYAESLSDGVEPRYSDLNGGATPPLPLKNDPNPGRNGEPAGELGLVLQKDEAWHGQTGAPTDPQAGNLPGTQRDVLRSASFTGNGPSAMFASSGTWSVASATYSNSTATGDNVSLFDLNTWLPSYYEVVANGKWAGGGTQSNAFIIFDYQDSSTFKYAGIDGSNGGMLKIGQRSASGWTDLATLPVKGLNGNGYNTFQLTANFMTATVTWGSYTLSYTFTAPINTGMLGLGANNSLTSFKSYTVQKLPFIFTYAVSDTFSDGTSDGFNPATGTWTPTSGTAGRYYATPPANDAAISIRPFSVASLSYVEYSATVNAAANGVWAGLIFNETSTNDFLFAAIIPGSNQVVLGHRRNGIWTTDAVAAATITAGTDYTLLVAMTEETTNTVNVVLNGKSIASFSYNYLTHDGNLGLFARNGNASFDNVLIRGDDQAYASGGTPQVAATTPAQPVAATPLTATELTPIVSAAKELWTQALGAGDPRLAILGQVNILIGDLSGELLGATTGTTIVLDSNAGGWGWFVDPTPLGNSEFPIKLGNGVFAADPASPAYGRMDLLTTVLHELGNAMGFAEDQGQDVTGAVLQPGLRRLPVTVATALAVSSATPTDVEPTAGTTAPPVFAILPGLILSPAPSAPVEANRTSSQRLHDASTNAGGRLPTSNILVKPLPVIAAGLPDGMAGSLVSLDASSNKGGDAPPAHSDSQAQPVVRERGATIAWDDSGTDSLGSGLGDAPEDWVANFLNNLGQDKSLWNPNDGLRVRPASSPAAR